MIETANVVTWQASRRPYEYEVRSIVHLYKNISIASSSILLHAVISCLYYNHGHMHRSWSCFAPIMFYLMIDMYVFSDSQFIFLPIRVLFPCIFNSHFTKHRIYSGKKKTQDLLLPTRSENRFLYTCVLCVYDVYMPTIIEKTPDF